MSTIAKATTDLEYAGDVLNCVVEEGLNLNPPTTVMEFYFILQGYQAKVYDLYFSVSSLKSSGRYIPALNISSAALGLSVQGTYVEIEKDSQYATTLAVVSKGENILSVKCSLK